MLVKGAERLDERGRERMLLGLRARVPEDEVLAACWAEGIGARPVITANLGPAPGSLALG
jgi:hypothetical protein